ncbi:unnamed protein product [Miscanthus lutarioriparius]|uniref:Uncharacterized protein n=1 Tax=Miscanthus lutarioriparius TaxID=422564 RepID=A0A811PCK8_9POAL|nr:unnamed protein product [Miscanthus lutarioriparius]
MAFSTTTKKAFKDHDASSTERHAKLKENMGTRTKTGGKGRSVRTRRLNPETLAREVAMAAEESGSTPGRCPTIMLDDTWTAYCDRFTTTMGRARYPTHPVSRAHRLHHAWSSCADRGSSSGRAASSSSLAVAAAISGSPVLGHSPGLGSPQGPGASLAQSCKFGVA